MKEIDEEEFENNNNNNSENKEQQKIEEENTNILSNNKENIIINENVNDEKEKSISTFKSKINELKKNYNFYTKYRDILFSMVNYLEKLTYEKLSNSIRDSCNYLSFFQETSEIYTKFAEEIKK